MSIQQYLGDLPFVAWDKAVIDAERKRHEIAHIRKPQGQDTRCAADLP